MRGRPSSICGHLRNLRFRNSSRLADRRFSSARVYGGSHPVSTASEELCGRLRRSLRAVVCGQSPRRREGGQQSYPTRWCVPHDPRLSACLSRLRRRQAQSAVHRAPRILRHTNPRGTEVDQLLLACRLPLIVITRSTVWWKACASLAVTQYALTRMSCPR